MGNSKNTASSGIGFTGLLTIAFIVLKLCDVIDWSWIWVLSPLWIGFALVIGIIIIVFLLAGLGIAIEEAFNKSSSESPYEEWVNQKRNNKLK